MRGAWCFGRKGERMQINLNDEHLKLLYYLNVINHSDEKHKGHHIDFIGIEGNSGLFNCIDCEKSFYSKISDDKVVSKIKNVSFKDLMNMNEIFNTRLANNKEPLGLFREIVTDYFRISYDEYYKLLEEDYQNNRNKYKR